MQGYLYLRSPFAAPPTQKDDHVLETLSGEVYVRKYVLLDLHLGLKHRFEQPSLLSSDASDDEASSSDEEQSSSPNNVASPAPASASSLSRPHRDRWRWVFGGDVSCVKVEIRPSVKTRARGKQASKKLYPLVLLTRVDGSDSFSWVTYACESRDDAARWQSLVRRSRDALQYLRACRDCHLAAPLPTVLGAAGSGDWKAIVLDGVMVPHASVCALAVFFRRQLNSSNGKGRDVSELRASGCGVGDAAVEVLVNVLQALPGLERLRMPFNRISDEGAKFMLRSGVMGHRLIELDLAHNDLSSKTALRLSEIFVNTVNLKKLDLCNNKIKLDGVVAMSKAIQTSQCPLEVLSLSGNQIGDLGAQAVASLLSSCPSHFRILRVAHCHIGTAGFQFLAPALLSCKALEQVRLHGNVASSAGVGHMIVDLALHHSDVGKWSGTHKSKLDFSLGGSEGDPNENAMYASHIRSAIASMTRQSRVSNLKLRRRGVHLLRSDVPPIRVTFFIKEFPGSVPANRPSSFGMSHRVAVFRAKIATIIKVPTQQVHVASSGRDATSIICIRCDVCAAPEVMRDFFDLAAQNDARIRALGVISVVETPADETMEKMYDDSSPQRVGGSGAFERYMLGSMDRNEEKKGSEDEPQQADENRTVLVPRVAMVVLPKLLPNRRRDLEYRRPQTAALATSEDDEKAGTPSMEGTSASVLGFRVANDMTSNAEPPPPPRQALGPASMANAYNLAAEFFGDAAAPPPPPARRSVSRAPQFSDPPQWEKDEQGQPPPPPPPPPVSAAPKRVIPKLPSALSGNLLVVEEEEGDFNDWEGKDDTDILEPSRDTLRQTVSFSEMILPPPPPSGERDSISLLFPPPPTGGGGADDDDDNDDSFFTASPPARSSGALHLSAAPGCLLINAAWYGDIIDPKKRIDVKSVIQKWMKDDCIEIPLISNKTFNYESRDALQNNHLFVQYYMPTAIIATEVCLKEGNSIVIGVKTLDQTLASIDDVEYEDIDYGDSDEEQKDATANQLPSPARPKSDGDGKTEAFSDELGVSTASVDDDNVTNAPRASLSRRASDRRGSDVLNNAPAAANFYQAELDTPADFKDSDDEIEDGNASAETVNTAKQENALLTAVSNLAVTYENEVRARAATRRASVTAALPVNAGEVVQRVESVLEDEAIVDLPPFMEKIKELCKAIESRDVSAIEAACREVSDDHLLGGRKWQLIKPPDKSKPYYYNKITGKTQYVRPEEAESDESLQAVYKFVSQISVLKQDFHTLHIKTEDGLKHLERYQEFMTRCAVLGYVGFEQRAAQVQLQECVMSLIEKHVVDPNSEAYAMILHKAQIVQLIIQRGGGNTILLEDYLNSLEGWRVQGYLHSPETVEEKIARIYVARTTGLNHDITAAFRSNHLKAIESAIVKSYLLNHRTPDMAKLEAKRDSLGVKASELLASIFSASKEKDVAALKRLLAEAKAMGIHAPGFTEAEMQLEKQFKTSTQKQAKEAISRAAKAISGGGTLSSSNTAELIPVMRLLEAAKLDDPTSVKDLQGVQSYMSRFSIPLGTENVDIEKELFSLLMRGDPAVLQDFLDGKSSEDMVVAASSLTEMDEWIEACKKAGKMGRGGAEDSESDAESSVSGDEGGGGGKKSVVLKKGMLMKMSRGKSKGPSATNWKERYCVLQGNVLTYYAVSQDKKTKTKKGTMLVCDAFGERQVEGGRNTSRRGSALFEKPNSFKIREGRDISAIDSSLIREARKQLLNLLKEQVEKLLIAGITARSTSTLKAGLLQVTTIGLDIKEDILDEARELVAVDERSKCISQLRAALIKAQRPLISESLKMCEKLGIDEDTDVVAEAREIMRITEVELSLKRLRTAVEEGNQKLFDMELLSIRSSASATEADKESLASLILQHAYRKYRGKLMEGNLVSEESRALRQALSAALGMRVEIAPMQLLRLGLEIIPVQARETGGHGGLSKAAALMGGGMAGGGAGGVGADHPYALDKCPLLCVADVLSEVTAKTSLKGMVKFAMFGAKRDSSMSSVVSKASLAAKAPSANKSVFGEPRFQLSSALTSSMSDDAHNQLALSYFSMVKVVVTGKTDPSMNMGIAECAFSLASAARADQKVAHEVYFQICKVLSTDAFSQKKNDAAAEEIDKMRLSSWLLLAYFLKSVDVTPNLCHHLKHHIQQCSQTEFKSNDGIQNLMAAAVMRSSRKLMGANGSTLSANLKRAASYCVRCIAQQQDVGASKFTTPPMMSAASNIFEGGVLEARILLMDGDIIEVPISLVFTDSYFPILIELEKIVAQKTISNQEDPKAIIDMQRRWNGFCFHAVNSSGADLGGIPIYPSENESFEPDSDIAWSSTSSEFLPASSGGSKCIVLRARGGIRTERFQNDFNPRVLDHEDYNKDMMSAKKCWNKWLASGAVSGGSVGLPSDATRARLLFYEEMKRIGGDLKLYCGCSNTGDAASYLGGLETALKLSKEQWAVDIPTAPWLKFVTGYSNKPLYIKTIEHLKGLLGDAKSAEANTHFVYLIHRTYLEYARTWPLYGSRFFKATMKQNQKIAMPVEVHLAVNGDGIYVLVDSNEGGGRRELRLIFQCRHADVDKCENVSRGDASGRKIALHFTSLKLEFELDKSAAATSSDFVKLVSETCNDLLWDGAFVGGTGSGDATDPSGSADQREMITNFLHNYPIMPPPPDPPVLLKDSRFFLVPASERAAWVEEEKEKERRAVAEAKELSEEAAKREQAAMDQATKDIGNLKMGDDDADDDDKGEKKTTKAKMLWKKAVVVTKLVGSLSLKHSLNSCVFGVAGRPSAVNYVIPDPPPQRKRFGVPNTQVRQLGGVLQRPPKLVVSAILHPRMMPRAVLAFPTKTIEEVKAIRKETQAESSKRRASFSETNKIGSRAGSLDVHGFSAKTAARLGSFDVTGGTDPARSRLQSERVRLGSRMQKQPSVIGEDEDDEDEDYGEKVKRSAAGESKQAPTNAAVERRSLHPPAAAPSPSQSTGGSATKETLSMKWQCKLDTNSMYAYYVMRDVVPIVAQWNPPDLATEADKAIWVAEYQAEYQLAALARMQPQTASVAVAAPNPTAKQPQTTGSTQEQEWSALTQEQQAYYIWWHTAAAQQQQQQQRM